MAHLRPMWGLTNAPDQATVKGPKIFNLALFYFLPILKPMPKKQIFSIKNIL
jgi:hypothetical protein